LQREYLETLKRQQIVSVMNHIYKAANLSNLLHMCLQRVFHIRLAEVLIKICFLLLCFITNIHIWHMYVWACVYMYFMYVVCMI